MDEDLEWDPRKARKNARKHTITFEQAAKVFDDIHEIVINDEAHSGDEQRFISIGKSGKRILTVSYTEREDSVRIISARVADRREIEQYYEQFNS